MTPGGSSQVGLTMVNGMGGGGWGVGGMVMGHRVQHPVTSERAQQQLGKYWSHIYNNGLSQLDLVYRQTPAQNDPKEQNGSSPN